MDANNRKKSKLESLAERIYSRTNPPKLRKRRKLSKGDIPKVSTEADLSALGIEESEKELEEKVAPPLTQFYDDILEEKPKFWTAPKIFLLASILFFMFSALFAYYLIVTGFNEVSTKNINMYIKGPNYTDSGDLLQFQVYVENMNNRDLDTARLLIDYPIGTIIPGADYSIVKLGIGDNKRKVVRYKVPLNTIKSGELKKGTVRARIFGAKDTVYPIDVSLEYRVKGSSAIFSVNRTYKVKISGNALSLFVKGAKEAIFGQTPSMQVELKNDSKYAINFVTLEAKLPLGAELVSSSVKEKKPHMWYFPRIEAGETKTIKMDFKIDGQSGDERVFKFIAGISDPTSGNFKPELTLQDVEHKVKVARPFLATFIQAGKEMDDGYSVVKSGQKIEATVNWVNTLANSIENVVLAMSLEGKALDKYLVEVNKGFYKSAENIIVWDKTTVGKEFEFMKPAQNGKLKFKFGTKDKQKLAAIPNPKIVFTTHASASRLSEEGVSETLSAVSKKEVRIETDLDFSARSLYFENPLGSKGALPPKVDSPTVYGVEWTVTNSSNQAKDVVVSAYLPPGVTWNYLTMPATESIEFNQLTGKLTWNLGVVKAGSGYYLPARRVYFNLVFVPSVTQIGKTPVILKKQKIEGTDEFTNTKIEYYIPNLDTKVQEAETNSNYFKVVK